MRHKNLYLFIYLSTIFIQDHPVQLKAGLNGGLFTYITTLMNYLQRKSKVTNNKYMQRSKSQSHKCLFKLFLKSESELSYLK